MPQKATQETLGRARQTLDTARQGLADAKIDPQRRHSGLRNLVVFGRAVTNVLQNLRSSELEFDAWYEPVVRELQADPLMKFFYELRTRILKQGDAGVSGYAHIKSLEFPKDMAKFGAPPKNAKSFFIRDTTGGSGWEVEIEPGVTEKYYVDLPAEIGVAGLYFRDAPGLDRAKNVEDADVIALSERYITTLQRILSAAETRFGREADA